MTCMPEAKLAREAELCYATVALATDYDCWRPHDPSMSRQALLAEIIENMHEATARSVELLRHAVRSLAASPPPPCGCQRALDLAIWTRKETISAEARVRCGILLERVLRG
jgi:5'-methylthioadenosine phosphorylase